MAFINIDTFIKTIKEFRKDARIREFKDTNGYITSKDVEKCVEEFLLNELPGDERDLNSRFEKLAKMQKELSEQASELSNQLYCVKILIQSLSRAQSYKRV